MIIESYTVILSNNIQDIIHFSSGISTLKREYSKIVQQDILPILLGN